VKRAAAKAQYERGELVGAQRPIPAAPPGSANVGPGRRGRGPSKLGPYQ
jgi:hypothetical protein